MKLKLSVLISTLLLYSTTALASLAPVVFQIPAEPSGLDSVREYDLLSVAVGSNIYQNLMALDELGRVRLGVASSYKISPDKKIYRFRLRPDAKWSDGQLVTLEHCRFGLMHALDPKSAAPEAEDLYAIKGARAYNGGKGKAEDVGVRIEGHELVIELEAPSTALLGVLTKPLGSPTRQEFAGQWHAGRTTTGRYFVKTYVPEKEFLLEPNPNFKVEGQRPILFKVIADESAATALFETGKINVLTSVPPTEIKRLSEKFKRHVFPAAGVGYIGFNANKPPFNNPLLRRVIAASINRESIHAVLDDRFSPTKSFIPPGIEGFENIESQKIAKSLGEAKGKSWPKISVEFTNNAHNNLILQRVQYDLKKKAGIELELRPVEWKTLSTEMQNDPPGMFYMGQFTAYTDPKLFLEHFHEGKGLYKNEAYESLVREINREPSGPKRKAMISRAEHMVIDDAVVIPVVNFNELVFTREVSGYQQDRFTIPALYKIR